MLSDLSYTALQMSATTVQLAKTKQICAVFVNALLQHDMQPQYSFLHSI